MTQSPLFSSDERTFTVASDDALVALVSSANQRLVIVSPALSDAVVDTVIAQLAQRPTLSLTIILDADPEVYRFGFGSEKALKRLHETCVANDLAIRKQPGLRIGLIVSDDTTMIFTPTPLLIEAGSKTPEKPNAVIIRGAPASQIAAATGNDANASPTAQEIGAELVRQTEIVQTLANLTENPPQSFDIARALRVFTSKVQYVEFEATGYKLERKVVPLPPELMDVDDNTLRDQITARIRSPLKDLAAVSIEIERDGKKKTQIVDGRWLDAERKRIEDEYLYAIHGFGKVILQTKRKGFKDEADAFSDLIKKYIDAVREAIKEKRDDFIKSVVAEYSPRWTRRPPQFYSDFQIQPTEGNINADLNRLASGLFDESVNFKEPNVRVVPKNIAPESMRDPAFKGKVEAAFRKRKAPESLIKSLFDDFDAAPSSSPTLI
jgi:hypothetical protein